MNNTKYAIAIPVSANSFLRIVLVLSLLLFVCNIELSASAAILMPTYPDDYSLAYEFILTADNYSLYETEHGNDVRLIYSLDDVSSEDNTLYVLGHGSDEGLLIKVEHVDGKADELTIIPWEEILTVVQENDITCLLIESCKGTEAQKKAQDMTFTNTLTIYAAAARYEDNRARILPGHPSVYSYNWLRNKDNNEFDFMPVTIIGEVQKVQNAQKERQNNLLLYLASLLSSITKDA